MKQMICLCIFLFIAACQVCKSQDLAGAKVRFLFYNVENLFDTRDDSLTDDDDFLPAGPMHWTEGRYRDKISALYKVIIAAGEWNPPVIAGFCEIENRSVLQDLIYDTWLSKYQYSIVTGETRDPRGIRSGLIYRKDVATLLCSKSIEPYSYEPGKKNTRKILYTKWLFGYDTLHLFLNHWPSRRRGVMAEEKTRQAFSSVLLAIADSIGRDSGWRSKILIAGDFNCTPDDQEIWLLCNSSDKQNSQPFIQNLSADAALRGEGTFKYRGKWEMLDQILVSGSLIDSGKGISTGKNSVQIFKPGFLLEKDPDYPGERPFSTYRGFKYHGGFSDHLPVIVDLLLR